MGRGGGPGRLPGRVWFGDGERRGWTVQHRPPAAGIRSCTQGLIVDSRNNRSEKGSVDISDHGSDDSRYNTSDSSSIDSGNNSGDNGIVDISVNDNSINDISDNSIDDISDDSSSVTISYFVTRY